MPNTYDYGFYTSQLPEPNKTRSADPFTTDPPDTQPKKKRKTGTQQKRKIT